MTAAMTSLQGQRVLVAGGTEGIGAAIVEQLAAEGAWPLIHYGWDRASAEMLLDRIAGKGSIFQADLSSPDGSFLLWRQAVESGRIHALINSAGIRSEVSVDAEPDVWKAVWNREFQFNFFAAADLCKQAIQHFREHGGGKIINMASRSGQRGYMADAMAYGATKAALLNLTKSIAVSFGREGVVAVAIAPGWVRDKMAEEFIARNGKAAALADIPIGEMVEPAELAELVAFVLRPSQLSLNGATLDVNGGSYIR